MENTEELGRKIAELRKERGMTQKELSSMIFVSDKNLSKWERGKAVPGFFYLKRLAEIFEVDLNFLADSKPQVAVDSAARMKKVARTWLAVLIILAALPLSIAVIARTLAPLTLPAHYNSQGEITRWASSITLTSMGLIYSALSILIVLSVTALLIRYNSGQKEWQTHFVGAVLLAMILVFGGITLGYAVNAIRDAVNAGYYLQKVDAIALLPGILCFIYWIFGGLCLIVRRNSLLGYRTAYSMKNDAIWRVLNDTLGIGLIISTFIMLICLGYVSLPYPFWIIIVAAFAPMAPLIFALPPAYKHCKKTETDGKA